MRAIFDAGLRVPEDISVIGFDGIDLGNYLTPRLTTIRQKSDWIADRSMEILVDRIEEEKEAIHELISFDIIAGESVAKVSAQK